MAADTVIGLNSAIGGTGGSGANGGNGLGGGFYAAAGTTACFQQSTVMGNLALGGEAGVGGETGQGIGGGMYIEAGLGRFESDEVADKRQFRFHERRRRVRRCRFDVLSSWIVFLRIELIFLAAWRGRVAEAASACSAAAEESGLPLLRAAPLSTGLTGRPWRWLPVASARLIRAICLERALPFNTWRMRQSE